ncbi:putative major facilitator, sugar transporter, major facilitator superfamily [Helianthus anomalus]
MLQVGAYIGLENKFDVNHIPRLRSFLHQNGVNIWYIHCKTHCYSLPPFAVVFIGSTLFALQQLSGINAIFYFSSTVFRSAGVPSNLANAFVGIVNLFGSIIALLLMDKLGRKVLLLWSFFGMAVSTIFQVIAAGLFSSTSGALYLSVGGMLM